MFREAADAHPEPKEFLLGKDHDMPSIGFIAPLLPGKTEVDRAAVISCWRGERRDAYQASRRRLGITREAIYIQPTPNGDVAVLYWEADDLDAAFKGMATSDDPFDRWYRDHIRDVHGMNVEDGFPPPEQVMDFRA
jgi:hypothetical protein